MVLKVIDTIGTIARLESTMPWRKVLESGCRMSCGILLMDRIESESPRSGFNVHIHRRLTRSSRFGGADMSLIGTSQVECPLVRTAPGVVVLASINITPLTG